MTRPPEQSRVDYYTEDAKPVIRALKDLRLFAAKMVGYVALVYGVVTLTAYYAILGAILVGFFWWLDRRLAAAAVRERGANPQPAPEDLPAT